MSYRPAGIDQNSTTEYTFVSGEVGLACTGQHLSMRHSLLHTAADAAAAPAAVAMITHLLRQAALRMTWQQSPEETHRADEP
jgi:hypothetical protein